MSDTDTHAYTIVTFCKNSLLYKWVKRYRGKIFHLDRYCLTNFNFDNVYCYVLVYGCLYQLYNGIHCTYIYTSSKWKVFCIWSYFRGISIRILYYTVFGSICVWPDEKYLYLYLNKSTCIWPCVWYTLKSTDKCNTNTVSPNSHNLSICLILPYFHSRRHISFPRELYYIYLKKSL